VATEDPDILKHLGEASELAGTATVNIIGGTGEARLCELGILHALIALCLLARQGQERAGAAGRRPGIVGEDPCNRGPSA
jgi:hypothetical protein